MNFRGFLLSEGGTLDPLRFKGFSHFEGFSQRCVDRGAQRSFREYLSLLLITPVTKVKIDHGR